MLSSVFLRRTAALVLVSLQPMLVQPILAAQSSIASAPPSGKSMPDHRAYGALAEIQKLAAEGSTLTAPAAQYDGVRAIGPNMRITVKEPAKRQANLDASLNQLRNRYKDLAASHIAIKQQFAATETHLRAHRLPAEILVRQQRTSADYEQRYAELDRHMQSLLQSSSASAAQDAVNQLSSFLDQHPSRKPALIPSPAYVPFHSPTGRARKPIESAAGFKTSLFKGERSIMLAGPIPSGIVLPSTTLPATPTADDLAATEDVQITPAISALANSLGKNPVKIYNWVRNNIQFVPTYGSVQGADLTLQSRRGNAIDTANLLIALFRASSIPARYAYGTIELPAERVAKWLSVKTPGAALSLLAQGGIPSVGVETAGLIASIKLEHVWVDAWVDYVPSRGAVNKVGNTWVPMDASFKLNDTNVGLNLKEAVAFNAQGVIDSAKQGAVCTSDSAQNINVANLQTAYANYKNGFGNFVTQQPTDITVGALLGGSKIKAEDYSILLGTLPYRTVALGSKFNILPDNLRWKMRYAVYADAVSRSQGSALVSLSASLPQHAGKRVTLSFVPATAADATVLASYMPKPHLDGTPILANEFPADLPAYLIRVKAELRVHNQVVATSSDFVLGTSLLGSVGLLDPATAQWNDSDHEVIAGEYHALVLDHQGIGAGSLDALKNRLAATKALLDAKQYGSTSRDDVVGDLLNQAATGYFALVDANSGVFQRAADISETRLPSAARAVAKVEPQYALGIITKARFPGVIVQVDALAQMAAARNGESTTAYTRQSMERSSAYAHLALEKLFVEGQPPGDAASTVKALTAANTLGQKTFVVTSANVATVLPQLGVDLPTKTEIQNAVAASSRVIVGNGIVSFSAWNGTGYITENTEGGGAYRLTGGTTGAYYPAGGMGWLALASTAQAAASVSPSLQAGSNLDSQLTALLGDINGVRWQYFSGHTEVINGLFLSRLNALSAVDACSALVSIISSGLATSTGTAPGGSINRAPVISSAPITATKSGQTYGYQVLATDADGDLLSYRLTQAPGGMSISASGLVSWDRPVEGSYTVTLQVDDGKALTEQRFFLTVTTGDLPLDLSLAVNPSVANSGDPVTISLLTNGGIGTVSTSLTIDGLPVPLVNGAAQITAGASGAHKIVATATDTQGTLTREAVYSIRDATDTTVPIAQITSPVADAEIAAPLTITGTASDARLAYYQLLLRPVGTPDTAWQEIGRGYSSVTNAALGKLDPTQIANGLYQLALNVVDANGQATATAITVDIYRDLKIGQFSVTFEDLNVEAVGIPIHVTRTYDTRRKAENLDFGYGWSVDYQNLQLRKNMTLGLAWEVYTRVSTFEVCLRPIGKRKINITLPTGQVERFDAKNASECGFFQLPPIDVRFTPYAGTTSTLEMVNVPTVVAQGGMLFDMDNLEPWNQKEFKLTTQEGFIYYLTEGIGVTQVKDPYGNTLTYGKNGITHSSGQAVSFTRDAQGRISTISDPSGKTIRYAYDARGDLISVIDRLNQTSQYSYNRRHGLLDFTDPRGIKVARQIYDDQGRLIATIDADGNRIDVTHDMVNNKEVVKDRRGNVTTYTYDDKGNVTEIVNALGEKTLYTYDALGNETTVTNALNQTTTRSFDAQRGNLLSEANPLGQATTYTYDPSEQPASVVDALGNATSYTNTGTQLDKIVEPLGRTSNFGYDSKGNLRSINVAGASTGYTYDAKGNRTSETDAAGNVITYTFDVNNRETGKTYSRTTETGAKVTVSTTRVLDAEGRVTAETDGLAFTTRTSYNAAGKVTSQTDPMGRSTSFDYDAQARLTKTTYPDGTSESTTYDAEGNEITQTDRAGRITRMEYDALNRLVKTIYPDGTANQTVYDAAGRVDKTRDAQGNPITNVYDAAGRLTQTTDALGSITQFAYDANGNRTRMTDSRGNVTLYAYDALNRLIKTTYPDLTFSTIVWRIDGRKDIETDAAGNSVQYGYDPLGRLASVTQTVGGVSYVTAYGYDELGNKVRQTDAENRATQWAFDNNNRVTQRILPLNQTETYTYDATGNRIGQTDFLGKTSQVFYDADNRPVLKKLPDGTQISYTYTNAGQIASITDSRGTTKYSYDTQDRTTRVDHPDGTYLAYAYDANGNRTEVSTPSGTVRYAYDKLNRLFSVTDLQNKVTAYQYDANGNRAKEVLPNGTETHFTFNANNRLTEVVHKKTADTSVLRGFSYTLAANGQRTGMTEYDAAGVSRTIVYAYDAMGRLIQEAVTDLRTPAASRTVDYAYDKVGNRKTKTETVGATLTSTTYQYDANDRLTTDAKTSGGITTTTTYAYDANGNTRAKTVNGVGTFYIYDSENKLVEVKQGATEVTAQTTVTFQYDAQGNRISKTEYVNGVKDKTTSFLVDTNLPYAQVVEEREQQGVTPATLSAVYVYGNSLIQQTRGGQGTFYHADGLGSTRMLSDATGAVTDAYDYEAFGNVTNQVGATRNDYRFAGERFDQETGFYYNRARYLNLEIGRFTTMDVVDGSPNQPITQNKYLYANADPINNIDPSGEMSLGELGSGLNVQAALTTLRTVSLRGVIKRVISETLLSPAAAKKYVRECLTKGLQKCQLNIAVLLVGSDNPDAAEHILDSQLGRGSNLIPHIPLYNFLPRPKKAWYTKYLQCNPVNKAKAAIKYAGRPVDCDEFPFYRSRQGGPENYPARTSLRFIPRNQNQSVGGAFGALAIGKRKDDKFLVLPLPDVSPITTYLPLDKFK